MSAQISPIRIDGRYFWRGNERFVIRGIVYQIYSPRNQPFRHVDPLADDRLPELKRDLALFKELGVNTLYVYYIDNAKSHDVAMNLLADAGIYVFACISTVAHCVNRSKPLESYNTELLNHHFTTLDCIAAYPNTIGAIASKQVINNFPSTVAAEAIRALVRDVKRYMKLRRDIVGQRVLPVGICSADVPNLALHSLHYFAAGNREEAIDFYALNNYSWAGKASMQISGYNNLVRNYSNSPIPIFFSEYGAKVNRDRIFQETKAQLSREMTHVFSGGCVYEFMRGANEYGIVKFEDGGEIIPTSEFQSFKTSLEESQDQPCTDEEWASDKVTSAVVVSFPPTTATWRATPVVPPSPLDWSMVEQQIEEKEWVVVGEGKNSPRDSKTEDDDDYFDDVTTRIRQLTVGDGTRRDAENDRC